MESKEHVNPFIDVHKKAEALRKRAREEHEKDEALREKRSEAESDQLKGTVSVCVAIPPAKPTKAVAKISVTILPGIAASHLAAG